MQLVTKFLKIGQVLEAKQGNTKRGLLRFLLGIISMTCSCPLHISSSLAGRSATATYLKISILNNISSTFQKFYNIILYENWQLFGIIDCRKIPWERACQIPRKIGIAIFASLSIVNGAMKILFNENTEMIFFFRFPLN